MFNPAIAAWGAYDTQHGVGRITSPLRQSCSRNISCFEPGPIITRSGSASMLYRLIWKSATAFRRVASPATGKYALAEACFSSDFTAAAGTGNGDSPRPNRKTRRPSRSICAVSSLIWSVGELPRLWMLGLRLSGIAGTVGNYLL